MPISSIDFTTLAPRSVEASAIAGREMQLQQHIADQGAANMTQKIERDKEMTVETQESDTDGYDVTDKEEGQASYTGTNRRKKREKDKNEEKKEEEAPMAPKSDSRFDIMI